MASAFVSTVLFLSVLGCLSLIASCGWTDTATLSGLLGAPSEMSQEELRGSSVRQAAMFAIQQLNLGSSSTVPYVLDKVVSGTSQVSL